jgi:hypothetical protein
MQNTDDPRPRDDLAERLPLPSEDTGDLVEEPASGMTDDYLVAREEGLPYSPPTERVVSETRGAQGPDVAGTAPTISGELERLDDIQVPDGRLPADDELLADVLERLRASDVPAGDRLEVAAEGHTVVLRGSVESVDVLDEILGIVGETPGVKDVVDEVDIPGL